MSKIKCPRFRSKPEISPFRFAIRREKKNFL